jgi:4'-phosphopantetheinyl transferase EntD
VSTAEVLLGRDDLDELHPDEAVLAATAVAGRVAEFRAGRHCARAALAAFGVRGVAIGRKSDRSPIWPEGFVGSISHTRRGSTGYCCAAVARASDLSAVGIDAETDEPLERALFARVMTPHELSLLGQRPEAEQGQVGKLVFSAKESVYKCQHPLSGVFLEFTDVEVALDLAAGRFVATLRKSAGPFERGAAFEGQFARKRGLLVTAVSLSRLRT